MQKITLAKSFKTKGLSKVVVCSLTTGTDAGTDFTGGAGADTFNAGLSAANVMTLQALDVLNGGAGADTVNITMSGNVTPNMTAIETVNVSTSANSTLDLISSSGVTSVSNTGSTLLLTVANIGSSITSMTLANSAAGGTFNFLASTVTGANDAKTFTVSNVTGGALTIDNAVEAVTVNSIGAANTLTTLATTANTVNITGSAALTITTTNTTAETITSTSTGAVTLTSNNTNATTITTGAGADSITFTGGAAVVETVSTGAGDDTVTFTANLADTDVVNGGAGTDTLAGAFAELDALTTTTAAVSLVSNFEAIEFNDAFTAGQTFTVANVQATGINSVVLDALGTAGAATINFLAGTSSLSVAGALGGQLNVDAAGSGTADALSINNTDVAFNALAGQAIVATDFETLTISTSGTGTAAAQTLGAVTMTASTGGTTTLNLSGTNSLTTTATTGIITANVIDASGMTAQATGSTFVMGAAAVGVTTITGSAGADTLIGDASSTINGGAGNDTITGGAGNDTLNGDDGNDTITTGAGSDTVNAGAGNDTVVLTDGDASSADVVSGGEGTDVLVLTEAVTSAAVVGYTNFEILRFDEAVTLSLANIASSNVITTIRHSDAASTLSLSAGSAAITTLNLLDDDNTVDVTFARLVDTTSDTITITGGEDQDAIYDDVSVVNEEIINIVSGDEVAETITIATLIADDLTTLTLSGDAAIELTDALNSAAVATVNAASTTAGVDVDVTNSNVAVTMTGGTGNDILEGGIRDDIINGGVGNDQLIGNTGADTLNGGAGNDQLTGGGGVDTLTGGAGTDTFIFATSATGITVATADIITDFTAADDTIQLGKANATIAAGDVVDGTLTADFATFVANASASLTAGNAASVYVEWNALNSGNAYVAIDNNDSGTFDAGDSFVILTGINLATEITSADFIA